MVRADAPDDELPKALAHFRRRSRRHRAVRDELLSQDGDVRTIQVTYSTPQRDEEVLCVIRDVTTRRCCRSS